MNKKIMFILILAFSLAFTACSKEIPTNNSKANESNSSKEDAKEKGDAKDEGTNSYTDCPHCKQKIKKDSKFCSQCGKSLTDKKPMDDDKDVFKKFDPKELVKDIDSYVGLLDIKELDMKLPQGLELKDDLRVQDYTGNLKKRYRHYDENAIRIPYLKENSELAKKINKEIKEIVKKHPPENFLIDYDAYIYEDVLSIAITFGGEKVVKTYNFDISDKKLRLLTSDELLSKVGADKETVEKFITVYVTEFLDDYYMRKDIKSEISEQRKEAYLKDIIETFNSLYSKNDLRIYKSKMNYSYNLYLPYTKEIEPFDYNFRLFNSITLGSNEFEMAILSKPPNALGFLYISDKLEVPKIDMYSKKTTVHTLNDPSHNQPIYIVPFLDDDQYIELADLEYDIPNKDYSLMVKKAIPKKINLPKTADSDIYIYHTLLAEGMPSEAICMDNGFISGSAQMPFAINGKNGYNVQYIFGHGILIEYSYGMNGDLKLNIKENRKFETKGNWSKIGIPITSGTYSNDVNHYYLFPCKKDIENGADEYYVLERKQYGEYGFTYGNKRGEMKPDVMLCPKPIDLMEEPYY